MSLPRGGRASLARWVTAGAAMVAFASGCAARRPAQPTVAFDFMRDTFSFSNETVWEYHVDAAPGEPPWKRRVPPPPFSLRCGNMARAVRQFRLNARFERDRPPPDEGALAVLLAEVFARDARDTSLSSHPVVIPGYADLRSLSAAHEALVKRELGGSWQSHLQRGNWRMIFPFPMSQQHDEAERLTAELRHGETPIVHIVRFPALTLNHVVLFYDLEETPDEIRFHAYDPNDAAGPIVVRWDRAARTFVYPRMPYFGGGPVKAYAIYDGLLT